MSCIDKENMLAWGQSVMRPFAASAGIGLLVLISGCSGTQRLPGAAGGTGAAAPSASAHSTSEQRPPPAGSSPQAPPAGPKAGAILAPPKPPRSHDELRLQAAHRLIQANPQHSYSGSVPEILLAIPVLEVTLNRDGSIKRIVVLRHPREEPVTVQLAIDALHRAAPFGDLSRLPSPWRFTETFLFNDERRFKPRSLD